VSPIAFRLWVDSGISVHFRRGSLQNLGLHAFGQAEHVDRVMHARLGSLDGVALVMDWRGGAGEIVYLVHFDIKREGDIVAKRFETLVREQMLNIGAGASEVIVDADDVCSRCQQVLAQMQTEEAGAACH